MLRRIRHEREQKQEYYWERDHNIGHLAVVQVCSTDIAKQNADVEVERQQRTNGTANAIFTKQNFRLNLMLNTNS